MEEDTLVSRRSRRSTAGNRMQAALAEIAVEDLSKEDAEEDKDFIVETYEEDVFESDFESTDEEEPAAAEHEPVENEEKQARKVARSRLERATAAAHARQKVTFNPIATTEGASTSTPASTSKPKRKRRVSLGFTINAQTGEVIAENDQDGDDRNSEANIEGGGDGTVVRRRKRSSKRQTTIKNTTDTVTRYLKSEQQKALQPSRKRSRNNKRPTQAELLARALDTEEGNLVDHRDYLMLEEEKRRTRNKRDQVTISGPLLRWVSKVEEVKIEIVQEKEKEKEGYTANATPGYADNPYLSNLPSTLSSGRGPGYTSQSFLPTPVANPSTSTVPTNSASMTISPTASASSTLIPNSTPSNWPPTTLNSTSYLPQYTLSPTTAVTIPASTTTNPSSTTAQRSQFPQSTQFSAPSGFQLPPTSMPPTAPGSGPMPEPEIKKYRTEKVAKSYLVHELNQDEEDNSKPSWEETMEAMFGNHVKWGGMKVYTVKNRPLTRYIPTCPITGLPAKYLDPRTGVPFANIRAYNTLKKLRREFLLAQSDNAEPKDDKAVDENEDKAGIEDVWDNELGCYIGDFEGNFVLDEMDVGTGTHGDPMVIY
ncbi:YL1 nuclear protein-domain-containing protein [Lentinula lateritia]|uniref:YL1 nuclear protein-domain-containing protein n=1 Tax=Lentinula lateritia TaxID=40482 RepID=A0ABQ8V9G6_9AGAR|nr:YL1 nuclear protein-domain-containing protein [Lentinula lateritia]